jgi:hypothetical protein
MSAFRSRHLASIAVLLVAALAGSGMAARASDPTSPGVTFRDPLAGQTAWHAGRGIDVTWTEPDPATVTARSLLEQRARPDLDGGCASATWGDNMVVVPEGDSWHTHVLAGRFCFRWTITVTQGDATVTATSGTVRTYGAWSGKYNLFRRGAFSTQKTFTWCTAASAQMMLNLIDGGHDHSRTAQHRIMAWERHHDRYPAGVARGSDPLGWTSAVTHFGGGSYHWVNSRSRGVALRRAATRMRLAGKPVGLLAMGGNHAWVMVGFTATADPAFTRRFRVTGIYVMGALYPLMKNVNGYWDPEPGHYFSTEKLAPAFTRYYDSLGPRWSLWEGRFVTVNP